MPLNGAEQVVSRQREKASENDSTELVRRQLKSLQLAIDSGGHALTDFYKKAEASLWAIGPRLATFTQKLPCLAFLKDKDGRYTYVNEAWESFFGKKFADWHNKTDSEIWPEAGTDELRRDDLRVLESGASYQTVEAFPGVSGTTYLLVAKFPVEDNKGEPAFTGGIAIDITERQSADKALRESEQRYRDLFEKVLSGIYRSTPEGQLLLANPALVRMLGFGTFEELTSDAVDFRMRSRSHRGDEFSASLARDGRIIGFETVWIRRDGGHVHVRETVRAVRGEDGAILYHEGIVEDVTGKRRAERLERDCNYLLQMVARNEPLDRILTELCLLVERQSTGRFCSVMLFRGKNLVTAGAPHLAGAYVEQLALALNSDAAESDSPPVQGKVFQIEDIEAQGKWENVRTLMSSHSLRSCWIVPVCSGDGDVLGCLTVYHTRPGTPGPNELELLAMASRLAALGIEHRELYADLAHQAAHDPLTDLPNRSMFDKCLEQALLRAEARKSRLAVLLIDLDRFKDINDTLGHRIGDILIQQVAARFAACAGPQEMLARMGGDEFALLMPVIAEPEAANMAKRLLDCIRRPFHVEGYEFFVTASIGISIYPDDGIDASVLQQHAETAMYRAKTQGKDRYQIHDHQSGLGAMRRFELENGLRRALENGELELFYQRQVDLKGKLRGVEALLRWNHPKYGILAPDQFISIAEDTGLIVPIGSWVVHEACRQAVAWSQLGFPRMKTSVNVSALQFYYADFAEVVHEALEQSGLEPEYLEVELTESIVMRNCQESSKQLEKLRALGVTIAIDDFGTGYSSLSYLQRLPVNTLKIDRCFLRETSASWNPSIIQAITFLAHSLGLSVIVEGVETNEQLSLLETMGADCIQGFLVGRPVPAEATDQLFANSPSKKAAARPGRPGLRHWLAGRFDRQL